jgi:hypothetical protein
MQFHPEMQSVQSYVCTGARQAETAKAAARVFKAKGGEPLMMRQGALDGGVVMRMEVFIERTVRSHTFR